MTDLRSTVRLKAVQVMKKIYVGIDISKEKCNLCFRSGLEIVREEECSNDVKSTFISGPYLQSKTKSLHFRRKNNYRLYEKVYHFFYHLARYHFSMLPVIHQE